MPKSWEKVAQQKRHREHLRRMRDMKSSVDDKPPRQLPKNNKKEIERVSLHLFIDYSSIVNDFPAHLGEIS
jgi:hypothetical protein